MSEQIQSNDSRRGSSNWYVFLFYSHIFDDIICLHLGIYLAHLNNNWAIGKSKFRQKGALGQNTQQATWSYTVNQGRQIGQVKTLRWEGVTRGMQTYQENQNLSRELLLIIFSTFCWSVRINCPMNINVLLIVIALILNYSQLFVTLALHYIFFHHEFLALQKYIGYNIILSVKIKSYFQLPYVMILG